MYVSGVTRSVMCHQDFVAVSCLTIAGALIGTTRRIQVNPDWHESPSLWCTLVSPPGTRKTPAVKAVKKPVTAIEQASGGKIQHIIDDITVEALADAQYANPRGLLLAPDELIGWTKAMNAYKASGQGNDRQAYLKMWSGEEIRKQRKTNNENIYVPQTFLSVLGGIQPGVVSELVGKEKCDRFDGFIDRILFSFPETTRPTSFSREGIGDFNIVYWSRVVNRLAALQPVDEPVRFSPKAGQIWTTQFNHHLAEYQRLPEELQGPYSKLEGYAARICLILHEMKRVAEMDYADDKEETLIDEKTAVAAWSVIGYFKAHARIVHLGLMTGVPEDRHVPKVLTYLRKQKGHCAQARHIQQACNFKTRSERDKVLRRMDDLGIAEMTNLGTRKNPVWKLATADL